VSLVLDYQAPAILKAEDGEVGMSAEDYELLTKP